jgi:hypothetical protein
MATSLLNKDEKIQDLQIKQKEVLLVANLVTAVAEDASVLSIGPTLAARLLTIDLKEAVRSVQKVRVINRATGASIAITAVPAISGNTIAVTVDGTGASSVCIEVSYKN